MKLTSRWSSCGLWLHWKRKGNKSGHSPDGTAYFATMLTTLALAFLTGGLHIAIAINEITKRLTKDNNDVELVNGDHIIFK